MNSIQNMNKIKDIYRLFEIIFGRYVFGVLYGTENVCRW
jgi:hypothetical protein